MAGIDLTFMAGIAAGAADSKEQEQKKVAVVNNNNLKKVFFRQGNSFSIVDEPKFDIHDELPPGTYTICASMTGFYLERRDDFGIDHKIYGNAKARANRIRNTFKDRPGNTGVLLEGEKGSGKTLLAKVLADEFVKEGNVALIVGGAFYGQAFNDFLGAIKQSAVVIFDEFEKIYDDKQQTALLTTFDGLFSVKKLFVVTVNETHKVNSFFKNRPGRFMYRYVYAGLEDEFIREYCADNLKTKNKEEVERIIIFANSMNAFNFDMLKHIVEDMNRYNEGVGEVLKHLNITAVGSIITMVLHKAVNAEGKDLTPYKPEENVKYVDPLKQIYTLVVNEEYDPKDEGTDPYLEVYINGATDLIKMGGDALTYRNSYGEFTFKRVVKKEVETPWSAWA